MLSAVRLLTFTRPSSSCSRFQSIATFVISSQGPVSSETVMRAIRAVDDNAPSIPSSPICRPGADSVFCSRLTRKPLSSV